MAIMIKDPTALATKFTARASAAAPDYKAGVQTTTKSQSAAAIAAKDVWAAAVAAAAQNGSYAKGLQKSGDDKWRANASGIGATRYPQGVQNAGSAWAEGVTPYFNALKGLSLPPRQVKGQNMARVQAVDDLLRKVKTGAAA
jgi:hypothetical protein